MVDRCPCPLFLSPPAERQGQKTLSQCPCPRLLLTLATRPGRTLQLTTYQFRRNPRPRLLLTLATRPDSIAISKSSRRMKQSHRLLSLHHNQRTMKMTLTSSPCHRSTTLNKLRDIIGSQNISIPNRIAINTENNHCTYFNFIRPQNSSIHKAELHCKLWTTFLLCINCKLG